MRKLILSGVLVFLLALSFICVKVGLTFPVKTYSYNQLKEQSTKTDSKLNELTRLKAGTYAATEASLKKTVENHLIVKDKYDLTMSTKTEEQKQKALLGQDYDLSYLWIKLGNYATQNNCDLTLEVSQEQEVSDDENYILCDLKFKIVSGYDGVTDFLEKISNDTELGFIPENLKMYSEYQTVKMMDEETGEISEVEKLVLVTEFYKTNIPVSKTSISKIENEQTLEEEEKAAAEAAKNNTTNTTNKTNTTNTSK